MKTRLAVVTPVYNDWEAFSKLLQHIEQVFDERVYDLEVFAVDDCSSSQALPLTLGGSVSSVTIIKLTINVGHQRAIAVGLVEVEREGRAPLVAVMDSDGEDTPNELKRMVDAVVAKPTCSVVARRHRRTESITFRMFYRVYVQVFRLLTGHRIDFGNFSVLLLQHVRRLVHNPNIWNHFAATLIQSKVPLMRIPTSRGRRYAGQSHMGLIGLVTHGLGAVSVFSDSVFIRILISSIIAFATAMAAVVGVIIVRFSTELAVPGWTTTVLGFAFLLSAQAVMMPIMIAFLLLNNRSSFQNIPLEHASRLIEESYVHYLRAGSEVGSASLRS